jgi:hypothetical protein
MRLTGVSSGLGRIAATDWFDLGGERRRQDGADQTALLIDVHSAVLANFRDCFTAASANEPFGGLSCFLASSLAQLSA